MDGVRESVSYQACAHTRAVCLFGERHPYIHKSVSCAVIEQEMIVSTSAPHVAPPSLNGWFLNTE